MGRRGLRRPAMAAFAMVGLLAAGGCGVGAQPSAHDATTVVASVDSSAVSPSAAPATAAATTPNTGMNLQEIAAGDYSSIQGRWQNGSGETLTISGSTIMASVLSPGRSVPYDLVQPEVTEDHIGYVNISGTGVVASPPALIVAPAGAVAPNACSQGLDGPCHDDKSITSMDRMTIQGDGGTDAWRDSSIVTEVYYRSRT